MKLTIVKEFCFHDVVTSGTIDKRNPRFWSKDTFNPPMQVSQTFVREILRYVDPLISSYVIRLKSKLLLHLLLKLYFNDRNLGSLFLDVTFNGKI